MTIPGASHKFLSLPEGCPFCVVALDPVDGRPIAVNSTFESILGPYYKFKEWEFADAASEDVHPTPPSTSSSSSSSSYSTPKKETNRSKFRDAINKVRIYLTTASPAIKMELNGKAGMTVKIRNVEMLTLASNEAGLPVRKYFDWTIVGMMQQLDTTPNSSGNTVNGGESSATTASTSSSSSVVMLYGDMVNEAESSDRACDADLIDFFQNAPIAMHWLNGEGIILWANQTELNVLGYTAEEFIGQPIMNFCPDEKELVLELFLQLGSGNSIADVPIRFRNKDGRLVHFLVDSNVAYNKDGSFGHTRCFIRDDTARKIRDARTKLLLEETERTLRMLDGFLSRTLHHVMWPLHALRGTCDIVRDSIQHQMQFSSSTNDDEDERNCRLLEQAADTVMTTTRIVADVSDLARFHEGANLNTNMNAVNLRDVGLEAMKRIQFPALRFTGGDDGITVALKLVGEGGPAVTQTDYAVVLRVLAHLLDNAFREVDSGGQVTLQITSTESNTLFEVIDNGNGLPPGTCLDQGSGFNAIMPDAAAAPFHRITTSKALSSNDPDEIQKVRAQMEEKLKDLKQNGVGAGLPLSYHLVRSLGGDLRHDSQYAKKGTRIWFALPTTTTTTPKEKDNGSDNGAAVGSDNNMLLTTETIFKKDVYPPAIIVTSSNTKTTTEQMRERSGIKRKYNMEDNPNFSIFSPEEDGSTLRHHHPKLPHLEDPNFPHFASDGSTTSEDGTTVTAQSSLDEPAAFAVATCGVRASMPFSVLVVEDTDICARLLMMQLKKMKCSTQRAENGRAAVDILRDSLRGSFDMVLMDLRMPIMDGMEATKLIRNELNMKDLPIIALTGEMSANVRDECDAIGFDGFFQKPLKRDQLQDLIDACKEARFGYKECR